MNDSLLTAPETLKETHEGLHRARQVLVTTQRLGRDHPIVNNEVYLCHEARYVYVYARPEFRQYGIAGDVPEGLFKSGILRHLLQAAGYKVVSSDGVPQSEFEKWPELQRKVWLKIDSREQARELAAQLIAYAELPEEPPGEVWLDCDGRVVAWGVPDPDEE